MPLAGASQVLSSGPPLEWRSAGLPTGAAFLVPCIAGIFVYQLLQMTISPSATLEPKVVSQSSAAKGFPDPPPPAWILGVSDGAKSALKTFFPLKGTWGSSFSKRMGYGSRARRRLSSCLGQARS